MSHLQIVQGAAVSFTVLCKLTCGLDVAQKISVCKPHMTLLLPAKQNKEDEWGSAREIHTASVLNPSRWSCRERRCAGHWKPKWHGVQWKKGRNVLPTIHCLLVSYPPTWQMYYYFTYPSEKKQPGKGRFIQKKEFERWFDQTFHHRPIKVFAATWAR